MFKYKNCINLFVGGLQHDYDGYWHRYSKSGRAL